MDTGVYQIRNKVNGKVYVGSVAKDYGFKGRMGKHSIDLLAGKHHSKHLQRAWDKYGPKAFVFEVLEELPPEDCVPREQYWMDRKKSANGKYGYNCDPTAGSRLGHKPTEEARRRMSEAQKRRLPPTQETKDKISAAKKGKPISKDQRLYLSLLNTGKPWSAARRAAQKVGLKWTEERRKRRAEAFTLEVRKKISDANKARSPEVREKQASKLRGRPWSAAQRAAYEKKKSWMSQARPFSGS